MAFAGQLLKRHDSASASLLRGRQLDAPGCQSPEAASVLPPSSAGGASVGVEAGVPQPASRPTSIMAASKRDSSFFKLFPPHIFDCNSNAGAQPSKYTKHDAAPPVLLPIFYKTLALFTTENPAIFMKFMTSAKKSPRRRARGCQKSVSDIVQKLQ